MQKAALNNRLMKDHNAYLLFTDERHLGLESLIEGIVNKENQALEALYELTVAKVYGLALRITQNYALAEEVVVDTYWQAWRDASNFNLNKGPLIAWLLVICRSRAIDAIRRNDNHFTSNIDDIDLSAGLASYSDHKSEPDNQLQQLQNDALLHRYINGLSATQKQIIHLAYFRGLTHEEISRQMHMPLGSVKSNIKRAQATLKQQLTQLDGI
jgi:RNA polymerase sigma factor (sigma-70 family)